jgi:Ca2+-transporting ATPase
VAMGDRGTEVARQAADLVLADDNLATVVVAVGEGRRIYANIRTFLRYGLAGGLAEIVVLLLGPFLGIRLPLGPGQILWINMITHGIPGVAFGNEPLDPALMRQPSPPPEQSVLSRLLLKQILAAGVLISATALGVGLVASSQGSPVQTWIFLTLGLAQLGVGLAVRAPRSGLALRERGLELAVVIAAGLQLLAVLWSPLRSLLGTERVGPATLVVLMLVSAIPGLLLVLHRCWGPRSLCRSGSPEPDPRRSRGPP